MNKYQERLCNEWLTHGKIIIGVDFDGTVSPWGDFDNQNDIHYAIKVLRLCKEVGCYITINTACNPDRFEFIRRRCKVVGIDIDSINANPITLPYGNDGKIYANVFIDDRSLAFVESLRQLEEVAYVVRANKHTTTEQQVEF